MMSYCHFVSCPPQLLFTEQRCHKFQWRNNRRAGDWRRYRPGVVTPTVNQQRAVPRAEVGCELGSNILSRLCEAAPFLSSQESFFEVPSNLPFTAFADNRRYMPVKRSKPPSVCASICEFWSLFMPISSVKRSERCVTCHKRVPAVVIN